MKRKSIEELDDNLKAKAVEATSSWQWIDGANKRITKRGLPWFEENRETGAWRRLPDRAQSLVRDAVWQLAQAPASANLAFRSNTTRLAVRARTADTGTMPHMAATGSRGLQLFGGAPYQMKPWATAIPEPGQPEFERPLFEGLPRQMREFRIYLPLYCGLDKVEIGLDKGAKLLAPSAAALAKPVVFYGTSITQGGCASTAGHDFVSHLGRLLNIETVNLGFSGNGHGEPEVARLAGEIDAGLFVLDYAANVDVVKLRRTLPRFMDILREKRPDVPVLIMTNVCFSQYAFSAGTRQTVEGRRDAMMEFYLARRKRGDQAIHFVDGFSLLPYGTEGAFVDGVHPTDHGFALMAQRLVPVIEQILMTDDLAPMV